ncbi:MAG TPA: AI-2E family transporter [Terriglobales bacterium]|nr:AI-2E family transporter [Terriglobales bacterium]
MQPSPKIQLDPRSVAVATAAVLGVTAVATLLFYLIDVLLLVFVSIVAAAALQPWHAALCRRGMPKAAAVLLLYLLLVAMLALLGVLILPILIEQVGNLFTQLPEQYENLRNVLRQSGSRALRMTGASLPPQAAVVKAVSNLAPNFYQDIINFTASIFAMAGYFVTVLAVALYWTLELPRVERFAVSFVPAARRAEVLDIWHEIEEKLGLFVRGQATAMVAVALASAAGYLLIGLPNVMMLALLAGLLEAVPIVGPILAVVPATAIALPLGLDKVALVLALALLLQVLENNLLIPRIMSRTVGMSGLVGLVSVLAFGTLYGIMGVFIAIPLTAAIQVLIDRVSLEAEPLAAVPPQKRPLAALRSRLEALRLDARQRLRERDTRLGLGPDENGSVADAVDNKIEESTKRVEEVMRIAEEHSEAAPEEREKIIETLGRAIEQMEAAVWQVTEQVAEPVESGAEPPPVSPAELDRTTAPIEEATAQVEQLVVDGGEGASIDPSQLDEPPQERAASTADEPAATPVRLRRRARRTPGMARRSRRPKRTA